MAQEEQGNKSPIINTQNTFEGGMRRDEIDMLKKASNYVHARNMCNYLPDGSIGGKHAEPSNILSATTNYTVIGAIYLSNDQWLIFSTDNTISEIGLFIDVADTYTTLINDTATITSGLPGFNFNTSNLITGTAIRGFDCGFDVYWSDGHRNPDRMLDTAYLNPNPWVQNCTTSLGCVTCVNTDKIDIQQLRLSSLITSPCLTLTKSKGSGQLPNGSYQVCIAYAANSIKCSDYIAFSNVYSTWTHLNDGGCITCNIAGIDDATKIRFTEMEVVVISMVNQQIQAKRLGIYSTNLSSITIDLIDNTLVNIPIEKLPIASPAIISSDAIFPLSNYLTRIGPKERPDFNYQPLANQIVTYWCAVEYDEDYYQKGGNSFGMNIGYLRGENYAMFIRFVYSTGDKSASYPIPGRKAGSIPTINPPVLNPLISDPNATVVASGLMEGWESTEIYPDHTPSVWNSNIIGRPDLNLCGQPIRHHKFPSQNSFSGTLLSHFNPTYLPPLGVKSKISVMGVYFDNIKAPVDNFGNFIPDIVGYEILRATRDGHESIIAKGMVNNMRTYSSIPYGPIDGIFQNYPYNHLPTDYILNPVGGPHSQPDPFLTFNFNNIKVGDSGNGFRDGLTGFRADLLSFHSPDTVFSHPYLGTGQLEFEMILAGQSMGQFTQPYKHPMFKVLTDFDAWLGGFISALEVAVAAAEVASLFLGGTPPDISVAATQDLPFNFPLLAYPIPNQDIAGTTDPLITAANILIGAADIAILAIFGVLRIQTLEEQILTIIKGLIPHRQYALQYDSYGFYNTPLPYASSPGIGVLDYEYIKGYMQNFAGLTVNNLYRNNYVLFQLSGNAPYDVTSSTTDNSRYNIGTTANPNLNAWSNYNLINGQLSRLKSYYTAFRVNQLSQYGQIDSTKQVPITCIQQVTTGQGVTYPQTPIMFGGDIYINRYTEKNPFMFFNDWLVNAPDDFKYDYRNYINVPYPMFWMNNDVINYSAIGAGITPSSNRRLDGPLNAFTTPGSSLFWVNQGYFYLFCNGIRDFFVESSVNVGYRDWDSEMVAKQFYDPYRSSQSFVDLYFRSDIIKSDIYYKYDYSLSVNKFINQNISWSQCLRRDYNPDLAYTCFSYYPRRVCYSLPQEEEMMQDNWRLFLPNNYKDFNDTVSVIKDMHKSGAVFLMESSAPMQFMGIEHINTTSKTEYSIGTGSLFNQTLQSVSNIDDSYEYASCQSKMGVVNTSYGLFWVSQKSGRVFLYAPGKAYYNKGETLLDIGAEAGLKYWLQKYLPSVLIQQFPTFPLTDNPVGGVGVQLIYDSFDEVLYITKKDYKIVDGQSVTYSNGQWYLGPCPTGTYFAGIDSFTQQPICERCFPGASCPSIPITFGDPNYFEDISWTLSYDCKKKEFVSFHDWHPSFHIPSKNHFFTLNNLSGEFWRHNTTIQSFCNFYNNSFPCEIEFFVNSQVNETVLQSVEWLLESYQYLPNTIDKFLNFDEGFDTVMVSNREQNSTLQDMQLEPYNNPYALLNFPFFDFYGVRQILYSKVENKYRVNNFFDYTKDRGFFGLDNTPMILTNGNGYTFQTNPLYFDLLKDPRQQKRFRYTGTRIFMRKKVLGKNSLTLRYVKTKSQDSPR